MDEALSKAIMELGQMKIPQLVTRYKEIYGKPPRIKNRGWIWKRIALKIEEERFGGLSQLARRHLEKLISEIKLPLGEDRRTVTGAPKEERKPGDPPVGTTLIRKWHGRQIQVRVMENGYEHDGTVYRSLSAIARAITGAHWNGRLFFGLVTRKRKA